MDTSASVQRTAADGIAELAFELIAFLLENLSMNPLQENPYHSLKSLTQDEAVTDEDLSDAQAIVVL